MKPENLLRATSTVLLMTLNVISALLFTSFGELKTDVKTVNAKIQDIQLRLYGAEKDISVIQARAGHAQTLPR